MKKNGMEAVAPGMEPTGHYWFNLGAFLQDRGIQPLHVNPYHVCFVNKKSPKSEGKFPSFVLGIPQFRKVA